MAASAYDPAGASKGQSPEEVKRETGESPVRSRHCKRGAKSQACTRGHWETGKTAFV